MLTLEKYKSKASRFECPACGHKNVFARYVNSSGQAIDETVGRCNREVECAYHMRPREFFASRGTTWTPRPTKPIPPRPEPVFVEIPHHYFEKSQAEREQNAFVEFLLSRYDHADVMRVCEAYGVGGFEGFTTFWRQDVAGRLWTAKLIKYNAATGKRRKDIEYSFDWMHALLKRRGVLAENSDYKRVLFGAHLLQDDHTTVALVEAEKTAVIAALELPEFLWLASGGRTQINVEKLAQLGKRRAILFPDGDAFNAWSTLAHQARVQGLDVHVSDLLETELTEDQKRDGWDLADYLLAAEPMPIAAPEPVPVACTSQQQEIVTVSTFHAVSVATQSAPTMTRADWRELYRHHCQRCGSPKQPDGSCDLCKRPLPF